MRKRLQEAALDLYREHGYEETTTSAIAARAGVTERTFFRHFSDKREVLFDGEAELRSMVTAAIAAAPPGLGPLETVRTALRSTEPMIEGHRAFAEPRHRVIAATPALQERELAKLASLASAVASALRQRGVDRTPAALAAQAGMAAFSQAALAWWEDPTAGFGDHLDRTFATLRVLASGARPTP